MKWMRMFRLPIKCVVRGVRAAIEIWYGLRTDIKKGCEDLRIEGV